MPAKTITTLLLGDIFGEPGCRAIFLKLKSLIKKYHADFVIANGENCYNGFGMSMENLNMLLTCGVDVVTSGNHIWEQEEILPFLDSEDCLLRPANYGNMVQGHGFVCFKDVGVINLIGRQLMITVDDPFKWASDIVRKLKSQTKTIFVDFHAESAEEKEALALYLDGEVTGVVGTHIHVQTNDEKILPKGTAYITDLGMCGPKDSVIGGDIESSIKKQMTQMPIKSKVCENEAVINGVVVVSDAETGKAISITRIVE